MTLQQSTSEERQKKRKVFRENVTNWEGKRSVDSKGKTKKREVRRN